MPACFCQCIWHEAGYFLSILLCCEPHHKRLSEKMLQFILSVCGWLPRPWATPELMMTHGARGIAVKSERPMEF